LAAGYDSGQDFVGLGGGEDKDNVGWWFLQGFEQGIGGAGTEHVDFVDDIDLIACLIRGVVDLLTEAADIIDAGVAGGINFDNIQGSGFGYCLAHITGIAGFTLIIGEAVHCLSQNTRGAGFAGSPWSAEEIGVRYTTAAESVDECLCYRFLSNYFSKSLGAPFTIKDLRVHILIALLYSIIAGFPRVFGNFAWYAEEKGAA